MPWEEIANWAQGHYDVGLRLGAILLAASLFSLFLRRAVNGIEKKVSEHTTPIRSLQRTRTLAKVLSSAGILVIWTIAAVYVLSEFGFDLGPLVAGLSLIGVAVGLGAQNLVKDVIAGFFILFEDQFGVGDVIEVNEVSSGRVEQLTLRVTGMRDLDGTMHYVSNGNISHVANRSKDWARAVIDVAVSHSENPARVRSVLEGVAVQAKEDESLGSKLYSMPEVLGVETMSESEMTWRVTADTKPARQWEVGRQLRERIKLAFDAEGLAYSHAG
jgi:small-conductance mechanosensitive channel